jgi:hypothetical protein
MTAMGNKVMATRKVPDNRRQDANMVSISSFGSIPSNRGAAAAPPDFGCGPRTLPAPLDPTSNADRSADDRAR